MKNAAIEREAPEAECESTEIPALLVAGGSCSRLCRPQRAASEADVPTDTHLIQSDKTERAAVRE